jgi:hypothetical protein
MDAGAYSYPRAGTPPTLQLSYSNAVAAPQSGTITVSGMPSPPAGQSNYVVFVSQNEPAIRYIQTAKTPTGSVTVTYQTNPVAATVTVPIDIYADGAHATATVTVDPGPPVLYSLVIPPLSSLYLATDQVNLEGPAPAGGVTVNLSSIDPSFLYTPVTVTVPAGQISATVGSLATNFFTPSPQTETLTATAGGVTKTLTRGYILPGSLAPLAAAAPSSADSRRRSTLTSLMAPRPRTEPA